MPRLHKQVGVLPIADDSPARRKDFLDLIGPKENVGGIAGNTIDGRPQRIQRAELVHHVAGGRVYRTVCAAPGSCRRSSRTAVSAGLEGRSRRLSRDDGRGEGQLRGIGLRCVRVMDDDINSAMADEIVFT